MSKSLNIFISLFKYFPYGGLQKDTLRFAREAVRRGHQVTLFVTSWEGDKPTEENLHLEFSPAIRSWSNIGRMDEFGRFALERLASGDFDVSLAMNRVPGHDFYFAADGCMKTYLPQKHGWLWRALSPRCHGILRQETAIFGASSRTRVLYIADKQRREFSQEYGIGTERLLELPPGMDESCLPPPLDVAQEIRSASRRELGLRNEDFLLLLAGTSFYRKGADRAISALGALPEELRKRSRFCMIGGTKADTLWAYAEKIGVPRENVIPLAPRPSIREVLLAADLMLHPAREEGTGTVLVEAIANGVPVLCTQLCGFSPYVEGSGCPTIPEPFRQESLNRALSEALGDLPNLRQSTLAYAKTQDFCGRSRVAIDYLEAFVRG